MLCVFCSCSLLSSPFSFCFPLRRRNSDPGSLSRLFFPLPIAEVALYFFARRLQLFLPASPRVELLRVHLRSSLLTPRTRVRRACCCSQETRGCHGHLKHEGGSPTDSRLERQDVQLGAGWRGFQGIVYKFVWVCFLVFVRLGRGCLLELVFKQLRPTHATGYVYYVFM